MDVGSCWAVVLRVGVRLPSDRQLMGAVQDETETEAMAGLLRTGMSRGVR